MAAQRVGSVALYVSVPVASFRVPQAREYLETLAVPPPSTVYGMLLSLVGETNRLTHIGAELALGLVGSHEPDRSTVLRTIWRVKDDGIGLGLGGNRRPDFQEILVHLELAVFVRQGGAEAADVPLAGRVARALANPASVRRFGGLALGESTHLVDEVRLLRPGDPPVRRMLISDEQGALPLTIWADHVGSAGTRWGQFALVDAAFDGNPAGDLASRVPERAWVTVCPPNTAVARG